MADQKLIASYNETARKIKILASMKGISGKEFMKKIVDEYIKREGINIE